MQDTFARALGQARATIGYLVYNRVDCSHICNVCCVRGDGFKPRCSIYVYKFLVIQFTYRLIVHGCLV